MRLDILSAGAAQGLVTRVAGEAGIALEGTFGAVGGILEKFLAGGACDVVILTHAQVAGLTAARKVDPGYCADLGVVRTAIAVPVGSARPDVSTPETLREALLAADAIHFPDPSKATAGIHFARVLASLGIAETVAPRLRTHPNGMTAMRALGEAPGNPVGCTQATEILATPAVALVAPLPRELGLATVYTAAIAAASPRANDARGFADRLTGAASATLRAASGFEGVAIRRARPEDAPACREVVYRVLAEYGLTPEPAGTDADLADLDAFYLSRGGNFDAAVGPDGAIVGCCGVLPHADGRAELRKMYLRREARGEGVGRRLLERAIAFARARGYPRLELETASVLTEAIALYRKAGFVERPGALATRRCDQAFVLELGA